MNVLGIETSCDDTSAGIFNGKKLLANVISTQIVHRRFGGVVPELASRAHIQLINPVIEQALEQSGLVKEALNGIAVTYGPGLAGSLLVGLSVAKGLSLSLGVPMAAVNHLEGHIWAASLASSAVEPPFIVLIVSGGHTQLVKVAEWGEYQILGRTQDDAAGEAFDKVAKMLNLGYPGGPVIEKLAREGDAGYVRFPRAYLDKNSDYFSFSGLKTAVLNHIQSIGEMKLHDHLADIACCFQEAVIDVLVEKAIAASGRAGIRRIVLGGGVAMNRALQEHLSNRCRDEGMEAFWPPPELCADNGGMIARTGYFYLQQNRTTPLSVSPNPSLNF